MHALAEEAKSPDVEKSKSSPFTESARVQLIQPAPAIALLTDPTNAPILSASLQLCGCAPPDIAASHSHAALQRDWLSHLQVYVAEAAQLKKRPEEFMKHPSMELYDEVIFLNKGRDHLNLLVVCGDTLVVCPYSTIQQIQHACLRLAQAPWRALPRLAIVTCCMLYAVI